MPSYRQKGEVLGDMRTKLLYVPRRYGVRKHEYRARHTFTPPLGTSILTAALREEGFAVDQDDLNARVFFRNWDARPRVKHDMALFDDLSRIRAFMKTGSDPELEDEADRILALTQLRGYDVVGLSASGQHNVSALGAAVVIAKLIKERFGSTIILGGLDKGDCPLPFSSLQDCAFIDFIVSGYGEAALLNLADALEHGTLGSYRLDGISWKGMHAGKGEPPYHQSRMPFHVPVFDGLPLNLYRYHPLREFSLSEAGHLMSRKRVLMLPYYFMTGCPYNCAFCGESANPGYRIKPVEQIVEDLLLLNQQYGARHFLFLNNMINPTKCFARNLSSALIKSGLDIRWSDCAHLGQLDRGLIEELKKAGAVRLIFGLETASERLLERMNKRFTLEQASAVLKLSHHAGIWNEVEVVCGLPQERESDIEATERFILNHAEYINHCNPNRFQLKKSAMLKNPARFGIRAVRPLRDDGYHAYGFDECGGLRWNYKRAQIQQSYERMELTMGQRFVGHKGMRFYRSNHNLPFLFYLYDLFDDKRDVEAVIHDGWDARRGYGPHATDRLEGYMYGAVQHLVSRVAR